MSLSFYLQYGRHTFAFNLATICAYMFVDSGECVISVSRRNEFDIRQVSLQFSYGSSSQTWMWFTEYNRVFLEMTIFPSGEINERSFSTLHTWTASSALRWRHNDHAGVSNHQPHGCLLNRLFRRRWKKTLKLRVTGLCAGNSPGPVNSPHKGPVTRNMFPFDDVIIEALSYCLSNRQRGSGSEIVPIVTPS